MNHQINIFDGNNNRIKLERVALNYTFLFDLGQMMFLFTSDSKEQLIFFKNTISLFLLVIYINLRTNPLL